MNKVKSTTVCAVLKDGKIAIGADGQATMGNTVAKSNVNKIKFMKVKFLPDLLDYSRCIYFRKI